MSLRDAHFFPNAALFFPIVKRFAVDLVDRSLRDLHAAGLAGHEEINVVRFAVGTFHIYAREIFAAAQTGKPIIVDPQQIERQVFTSVVDVELFVGGSSPLVIDVPFDSSRNINVADLPHLGALRNWGALRRRYCYLWHPRDRCPWV